MVANLLKVHTAKNSISRAQKIAWIWNLRGIFA